MREIQQSKALLAVLLLISVTGPARAQPSRRASESPLITLRGADLPLVSVLTQLARSAHLALVLEKEVKGDQVVSSPNLENLPLESALAVILTPLGYSFQLDRGRGQLRVFVFETRTFRVAVPIIQQDWQSSITNEGQSGGAAGPTGAGPAAAASSSGGMGARIALTSRSETTGLWTEVDASLAKLVGADGTYSVNKVAGFATVRTQPSFMQAVEAYFDALNSEMGRTVEVETKVFQVDFRDNISAGINWDVVANALTRVGALQFGFRTQDTLVPETGATFSISGRAGSVLIKALEEQGDVTMLAQPRLVLGNNLPAIIEVARVQNYISEISQTVQQLGGTVPQITIKTASVSDGLILSILPRLLESGELTLALATISQDVLSIRRQEFEGGAVELPTTARRTYNGVVRTKVGDVLVIGGLTSTRKEKRRNGLPFLSQIPIVGVLFGSQQDVDVRSELVITITPRAVVGAPSSRGNQAPAPTGAENSTGE